MLRKEKKAQSAIEFFILIGFVFFFFVSFLLAMQINQADKIREKRTIAIKEIVLGVQDEINLALESSDGYVREFNIPNKVLNYVDYNIKIVENLVYLRTDDGKDAIALPVPDLIGDVKKGNNIIRKNEGKIYLN